MASAATVRRRRGTLRQMCLSPPLVPALYTSQSKRHIVPDAFPNHRKAALRKAADCSTVYSWKRCCGVWGRAVPVDCCPMVNGVSDNRLPGWMHRPVYRLAATMVSFGATFLPFVTVTGLMSGFTEFRTGSAVGGLRSGSRSVVDSGRMDQEQICLKRRNHNYVKRPRAASCRSGRWQRICYERSGQLEYLLNRNA